MLFCTKEIELTETVNGKGFDIENIHFSAFLNFYNIYEGFNRGLKITRYKDKGPSIERCHDNTEKEIFLLIFGEALLSKQLLGNAKVYAKNDKVLAISTKLKYFDFFVDDFRIICKDGFFSKSTKKCQKSYRCKYFSTTQLKEKI